MDHVFVPASAWSPKSLNNLKLTRCQCLRAQFRLANRVELLDCLVQYLDEVRVKRLGMALLQICAGLEYDVASLKDDELALLKVGVIGHEHIHPMKGAPHFKLAPFKHDLQLVLCLVE